MTVVVQEPDVIDTQTNADMSFDPRPNGEISPGEITIERLKDLTSADLNDLCDATEAAIAEGGGFGWLESPERWVLENYWNGVVLIPQRFLWVGRVDGVIAGSVQLQRMPKNNEAQRFTGVLSTLFIAPWARRFGLARHMIDALEDGAHKLGMKVIDATVRTTQTEAMQLLQSMSYQVIGTHPYYALVDDEFVPGCFFTKALEENLTQNMPQNQTKQTDA